MCFPNAVQLRCSNHIRQNIKEKLRILNVSQGATKEILADIFGRQIDTHFEAGLVDSESEVSFNRGLEAVKAKWNNLEMSCNPTVEPQFHAWFCQYKADEIVKCVLPQARHLAGCRDPKRLFTTNNSESLNHVIKQEVAWKENQLPKLIDSLKAIVTDHVSCLEKAVIGRGEWHFTKQYESLVVTEQRWFSQMSDSAKKLHMGKVNSMRPVNLQSSSASRSSSLSYSASHLSAPSLNASHLSAPLSSASCLSSPNASYFSGPSSSIVRSCLVDRSDSMPILSVSVEESGLNGIADCTLQGMWAKAEKLVMTNGHILKVPWSSDHMARLVKSSTSAQPHLVTRNAKNMELFCCDKNCQMFKGFSLCSHVLAAAHDNGRLRSFLDHTKEVHVNLTSIANHGLPTGAGRKGGVAKKRKRVLPSVETRSIRPCLNHQAVGQHSLQPSPSNNPFVLKLKNNHIKVCQSCRLNYEGENNTLDLLVSRAERRMISNLSTGTQFLGKETNSHYHLKVSCIKAADPNFQGPELVVPQPIKEQLTTCQKAYLSICFQINT